MRRESKRAREKVSLRKCSTAVSLAVTDMSEPNKWKRYNLKYHQHHYVYGERYSSQAHHRRPSGQPESRSLMHFIPSLQYKANEQNVHLTSAQSRIIHGIFYARITIIIALVGTLFSAAKERNYMRINKNKHYGCSKC